MRYIRVIGLVGLCVFNFHAPAAEKLWVGSATSSNWFEAANWQPPGVPASEDHVTVTNGTIQITADVNVAALSFSAGRIINSNALTVTNFTWGNLTPAPMGSSAFDGSGRVVIPVDGSLLFEGDSSRRLSTGRLENFGLAVANSSRGILLFSGAVFHNTGTFLVNTNFVFDGANGPPGGVLTNSGTLIVTGQTARVNFISVRFDNTGTTLLRSGVFACGSGSSSGLIDISLTATQTVNGPTFPLTAGASFPGPGLLQLIGGAVNADTNDLVLSNLRLDGGTLTGTNTFVVSNFTWTSGTIGGRGLLRIPPGSSLVITGGSTFKTLGRELRNEGTGLRNGGTDITLQAPGRFHNVGTFSLLGFGYWTGSLGGGFYNSGTLIRSGPPSEATFYTPFTNAGRVRIEGSLFRTLFGYYQVAGITELVDGDLRTDSYCLIRAGKLSGTGRVGNLANYGEIHPGNPVGTLNIFGSFTNFGNVFIDVLSSPFSTDQINISFRAHLRGAMYLCLHGPVPLSPFTVFTWQSYSNMFPRIYGLPINEGWELVPNYASTSLSFSVRPGPTPVPARLVAYPCDDGVIQVRTPVSAGQNYQVQSSSNLVDWVTLFTTNSGSGVIAFFDPSVAQNPRRYYRLRSVPQ